MSVDKLASHVQRLLEAAAFAGLPDQRPLDVMQNGDDFYIIDMALAETSALKDCVPDGLLKPFGESLILLSEL